jgi:hypothetical protein
MTAFAVSSTTLVLNGRAITNVHQDDVITLSFPNSPVTRQEGRNATVIQNHGQKDQAELTINLTRFTDDHQFLNRIKNNPEPQFIEGTLTSKATSQGGDPKVEVYEITQGAITNQGDKVVNDSEGNQVQSYTITCIARSSI